jgi:3-phenylpropionate/trans-cinnamate dioxygenase ferredoxin subunit
MSDFVRVCAVGDVPEDGATRVEVDGVPVAVVNSEGNFYAIYDVCSHEEVSLSDGDVEGTEIECWLHGSCFDLLTGKPTSLPATKPVPIYSVKVDGDDVYVRLNDEQ